MISLSSQASERLGTAGVRNGWYPPREISTIIGAEGLSDRDKVYLNNSDAFETRFIAQGETEKRKIEETLDIGWQLFANLAEEDLKLISQDFINKYHPKYRGK